MNSNWLPTTYRYDLVAASIHHLFHTSDASRDKRDISFLEAALSSHDLPYVDYHANQSQLDSNCANGMTSLSAGNAKLEYEKTPAVAPLNVTPLMREVEHNPYSCRAISPDHESADGFVYQASTC